MLKSRLVFCLILITVFEVHAQTVYTVNTTIDTPDANPGDGICDDGLGNCSLRSALEEANQSILRDSIHFEITGVGPHRIVLTAALPIVVHPIVIDGSTQPGFSVANSQIIVDGNTLGITGITLSSAASNSFISGLSLGNFVNALLIQAQGVHIESNLIGIEPTGAPIPNTNAGIRIENTNGTVIGGYSAVQRNYIAGNNTVNSFGIQIISSIGDTIAGNYIGLAPDGITPIPNRRGLVVEGSSRFTMIGGEYGVGGNYISGNAVEAILVRGSSDSLFIYGNVIGLNLLDERVRNLQGIVISGTGQGHRIGAGTIEYRNVISGQNEPGNSGISIATAGNFIQFNYIGTSREGDAAISNWYGITLATGASASSVTDNVISGNGEGIRVFGGVSNIIIQRNKIGTDVTGLIPLGNSAVGIRLNGNNSIVGGTITDGNIIAANGDGIFMDGNAFQNIIRGNFIGTDITGNVAMGNNRGMYLFGADTNQIGGSLPDQRNLISANTTQGIFTAGQCLNNVIQGNYFGLGADGVSPLGNNTGIQLSGATSGTQIGGIFGSESNFFSNNNTGLYLSMSGDSNVVVGNVFGLTINEDVAGNSSGIWFTGSGSNLRIGGTTPEYRNIFSGNTQFGIEVFGGSNSQIIGNYFGTNFSGTAARANNRAIRYLGSGSSSNVFDNNLVSGNISGVELWNGPQFITITRNRIGIGADNVPLPNSTGIRIQGSTTSQNLIGGSALNANIIAGNTDNGILITGGAPANQILNNLVGILPDNTPAGNGGYGIDVQNGTIDMIIANNRIAYNGLSGVRLDRTVFNFPRRNRLSQNEIFSNAGLGIQLASTGPNLNDLTDSDDGANGLQNYPVISRNVSFDILTNELSLEYYIPSDTAHTNYPIEVEFYIDDGNRQGRRYLFTDVFTREDYLSFQPKELRVDVSGTGMNSTDLPVAIAIDSLGNTSEFGFIIPSPPVAAPVILCGDITEATLSASGTEPGGSYRWYATPISDTPLASGSEFFITNIISDTTVYLSAVDGLNIESVRIPMFISKAPQPVAEITPVGSTTICQGQSVTLRAPAGFASYSWSSGESSQEILVTAPGLYTVIITSDSGCISNPSAAIEVIVNVCAGNAPVISANNFGTEVGTQLAITILDYISDPENDIDLTSLRLLSNVTEQGAPAFIDDDFRIVIDYTTIPFIGIDALQIEICDTQGRCTLAEIRIEVFSNIIVYNAVSPNSDGKNDFFFLQYIEQLDQTRNNRVTIFNRWGDVVFQVQDYNNLDRVFSGLNENGDELPSGTYFYKIEFNSTRLSLTGFLSLKR